MLIYPRCKKGLTSDYISAHGFYFPCCWIANEQYINKVTEFLGPLYEQLDGKKYSLAEMKNSQAMKKIEESWKNEKSVCSKFCSDKINDNNGGSNGGGGGSQIPRESVNHDLLLLMLLHVSDNFIHSAHNVSSALLSNERT
jgi:hypothetical protein